MEPSSTPIRTTQDLLSLPGYRARIDPSRDPLKRIVKHYRLSSLAQCGLSTCGTWHLEGYVIELENGGLTNVGHVCGKQFGDRFLAEETLYQEKILRPKLVVKFAQGKSRVNELRQRIEDLATRVRALIRCRKGLKDSFPRLAADVARRAHQGLADVFEEIERTNEEIDSMLALNPHEKRESLRYRREVRGRIAGLQFMTADPARLVLEDLAARSERFLEVSNLQELSTERLNEWDGWLDNLDEQFRQGERITTNGEAFFSESNLRLLATLARDPREKDAIARLKPSDLEWTRDSSASHLERASMSNRRARRKRMFSY